MDIKFLATLIVSFGALLFSFLNYKRSRRIENENHIYKLKIDIYAKILGELNKLVDELQDYIIEAKLYFKDPKPAHRDRLDELVEKADDICFAFESFIISNSLIIPEKILMPLDDLCVKIIKGEMADSETEDPSKAIRQMESFVDGLIIDANDISDLLRDDLRIDELNVRLYKRLKS